MKKVILLFWLMPCIVLSQVSVNFETSILSQWVQTVQGHWEADTVSPLSGRYSLHHIYDNPDAGSDQTGLPLTNLRPLLDTVKWKFMIRHGYDPSASNNWSVFLMSDNGPAEMKPGGNINGYSIGVNLSGSDDTLRLWKIRNGTVLPVVSLPVNWQNNIGINSKVIIEAERSPAGYWSISATSLPGNIRVSAKASDNEFNSAVWFGVLYRYSSTRDRLFWIDDISVDGEFREDIEPPVIVKCGDVIISEIMADPLPPVSLPSEEYIEIMNRSASKIDLNGWKIISGEQTYYFPLSVIGPGGYAIICQVSDTSLFSGYGKVIGIKSFPVLTDGGKSLILTDSRGNMIHYVEYSSSWYGDPLRSEGGWSLEMVDSGFPFYAEGNWKVSHSSGGGTPGKVNSVAAPNPDPSFAGITNVFPSDSSHLKISLSEPVIDPDKFAGMATISGEKIRSAEMMDLTGKEISVIPLVPFVRGKSYTFCIPAEITDFAGNKPQQTESEFGLPEIPVKGDIVFNELLFNPMPGDADYIELYNISDKPVDASSLYISAKDDATGKTSGIVPVTEKNILLMPGKFHAVTSDREATIGRYYGGDSKSIYETGTMPSMPDDRGHLILLDRQLDVLDEVKYDKEMHYSLLSADEGVSLERINPEGGSLDRGNWHSASGSSGWGTPGAVNSVYSAMPVTDDRLQFSSTRISPDNDGTDDVLTIKLNLTGTGNVVTVLVFDENGTLVRKLIENLLSGPETYLSWDATDNTGSLLPEGIYIFLITLFNDTGKTEKWKRVCTIIR